MKYILAALLLTAIIVITPIAGSQSQYAFSADLNAQIGEESSITTQFSAVLDEPTNTTGYIKVYFNNQTGQLQADVNLQGNLSIEGVILTASGQGSYNFENGNYTQTYGAHVVLVVSNLTQEESFGAAQQPPFGGPPSSGGGEGLETLNMTLDISGYEQGYITVNESYQEGTLKANLFMKDGAVIFNMQGDIVANVTVAYSVLTSNGQSTITAEITVNFNSGDPTIDSFLASTVNTMIGMMSSNMGAQANVSIESQLINTTAVLIEFYAVSQVQNATLNTSIVPELQNATASIDYQFNLQLNDDGTFTLTAQADGNVNAPALFQELPTAPTFIDLDVNVNNQTVEGTLRVDTAGDPTAAFSLAKAILLAEADAAEDGGSLEATLTATGGYTFVLLKQGRQELGSQVYFTEENATLVKHLYLEPPGVDYEYKGEGHIAVKLEAGGAGKAELGFDAFAESKVLIVGAKGVKVNVGTSTIADEKVIVVNASDAQAKVKILPGTTVNGTLEIEALTQQEAEANASAYGYQAAGNGVKIHGIVDGTVQAAVKGDVQAAQEGRLAILEISADGSVKLITDVQVNGSMIVFTTSSFSTFVPVYTESGQTGGGETTTTTTGQQQTTTGGGQTQATTTTTTETTTSTQGQGETTTTSPGQEKTTTTETGLTTSETPPKTTQAGGTQQPGQEETATKTGGGTGGGIGNIAIAAIAVIIIIVAAIVVLMRR